MTYDVVKTFTDGGSRGNPGPSASGIVVLTTEGEIIEQFGVFLGHTTNNVAECKAVLFALEAAKKHGAKEVNMFMDSELVCKQLNGVYRIKNPDLQAIHVDINKLVQAFERVTFEHVYREFNRLADKQVNIAIDKALGLQK
jgi:ribonuclease HI